MKPFGLRAAGENEGENEDENEGGNEDKHEDGGERGKDLLAQYHEKMENHLTSRKIRYRSRKLPQDI